MAKIGIDIRMLGKRHGGIGRYIFELVSNLLLLDKQNEYFLFYNYKTADESDLAVFSNYKNANLIKTGIGHYSLAEQLRLPKVLNKYDLDLMHFPNFNVPIFYKKPFAITVHDLVHHKLGGGNPIHFLAYKKVVGSAIRKAKKIIAVSRAAGEEIIKYFSSAGSKIEVIYEGSSLKADLSENQVTEVKRNFFLDKPYFLFVGVLERKKNLVNLSRGFDRFLSLSNFKMDLVIAGKADSHYPEIRHHAMDIKHKNNLVFTGFVEDLDLTALYQGAFAYVSASMHEGYGLPGVEAMGFKLPLVVSDTPVFNEIYDDAAIYFDPEDVEDIAKKLNFIAKDRLYYERLQAASLKRSRLFDWKTTAKQTLGLYIECLNDKMLKS